MKFQIKRTVFHVHLSIVLLELWYVFQGSGIHLLLSFLALLLHEAGHFIVGKKLKFQIDAVELTPFGASMQIRRDTSRPIAYRFLFAAAGPVASGIGCLLAALAWKQRWFSFEIAKRFFQANLLLLLINLLPALPLDGGRMLRALLEKPLGYRRSTHTLVWIGYIAGCGLACLSLVLALRGQINLLPVFAGAYLCYAAAVEAQQSLGRYVNALIARRQKLDSGRILPVQLLAISEKTPLPQVLPHLSMEKYHLICLLSEDGMKFQRMVDEHQLCEMLLHPESNKKTEPGF